MIMFGSIYFVMPRVLEREWPYPNLVSLHFWLAAIGFGIYFFFLTIGGVLQGIAMLDPARLFMDSVGVLRPYMLARTFGGALMAAGHFVFAYHFFVMALNLGPRRSGSVVLWSARSAEAQS